MYSARKKKSFWKGFWRKQHQTRILGIAFGFLWCWAVFDWLSHFSQCSGAVPPWELYRWAHMWRNEPQAIIPFLKFSSLRLPRRLLTSSCFLVVVFHSDFFFLIYTFFFCTSYCHPYTFCIFLFLFLPPPLALHPFPLLLFPSPPWGDCVPGLWSVFPLGGLSGGLPKWVFWYRGAHHRLVVVENLPVHTPMPSPQCGTMLLWKTWAAVCLIERRSRTSGHRGVVFE